MALLPRTPKVEYARLRNLGKRVKVYSKRLRRIWPRIASFLTPREIFSVFSTCHQLQRLLDNDRVWQIKLDQALQENVTRLLQPNLAIRIDDNLSAKEKLRRVIRVRRIHDPTNALQLRLREAEQESFRLKLRQHKVRYMVWINVPLVLTLCFLSIWSYTSASADVKKLTEIPLAQLRGATNDIYQPSRVHPMKTFVLGTDLLLFIAVVILGVGDASDQALYTVGVLVVLEATAMVAQLVTWSSPLEIVHSFLVLSILIFNIAVGIKERNKSLRDMAAFVSNY